MSTVSAGSPTTYRHAEESELPMLADMKTRVYGGASMDAWMRRWPWQFVRHPWKPDDVPVNFLLAERNGRVVGGIGWIPTFLSHRGREHPAAYGCDLFIDPDTQGGGLGKSLIDQVWPRFPVSMWMNFDIHGARSYEKRGFAPVNPVSYMVMLVDPGRYLEARGRKTLGMAARWTRWPVRFFARVRAGRFRVPAGVSVTEIAAFDEAFDAFQRGPAHPDFVRPRRDAAYLRWRYLDCPFGPYRVLAARRGGELVGFTAFRARPRRAGRIGVVTELEADPRVPGLAEALLAAAVRDLVSERIDFIRAFPTDLARRAVFGRLGFMDARRTPYLYTSPGSLERLDIPRDGTRWQMALGDCDLDFS
jgi:GNAT superfamily N-acetyltransferase